MIPQRETVVDRERDASAVEGIGHLAGAVKLAEACLESWRAKTMSERGSVIAAAATALYAHKQAFAELLSVERAERISRSIAEVDLSVDILGYYGRCALGLCAPSRIAPILRETHVKGGQQVILVHAQSPRLPSFWLARLVALNLTIGNVVVLTHAYGVPRGEAAFENLWLEAGAPLGAFANAAEAKIKAISTFDNSAASHTPSIDGQASAAS